jgi:hypothetical protein
MSVFTHSELRELEDIQRRIGPYTQIQSETRPASKVELAELARNMQRLIRLLLKKGLP